MKLLYISIILFLTTQAAHSQNNSVVNCTVTKTTFSNYIAEFTSCSLQNSRPVKLCESCIDEYINVLEGYENLTKFTDENGPCVKNFVHLDRLEIIETLYRNTHNLWNKAKCYECFVIHDGVLTHNRSEKTEKFNLLFNNTEICINKTNKHPDTLCPTCMDTYLKLNDYYYDIINENDKIAGCMDIVDLMNTTRAFWSEKCCKSRKHNEIIFLSSTGCMLVITILFYVLTKLFMDTKKPALYRQTRFSESLAPLNEE